MEFGRRMGCTNFRNFSPIDVAKRYRGEIYVFWRQIIQKTEAYDLELGLYSSITDIVEAICTLVQDRNNHEDTCITIKSSHAMPKKV